MQSKREIAIDRLQKWHPHLRCPNCQKVLQFTDNQLKCPNRHSFDVAKSGYVNLAPQHHEKHYTKPLFEARYLLMHEKSFYTDFTHQALQLLTTHHDVTTNERVIDLGTGEGTHFAHFIQNWQDTLDTPIDGIGLDLAKDGIQLAAKHWRESLWLMTDLSHLPFADKSVDGALTILSPSHYVEIQRALVPGGWFIKAIPGPSYLQELRAIVQPDATPDTDTSDSVTRFKKHFECVKTQAFKRTVALDETACEALIAMTPLMWHATDEQKQAAKQLKEITINLVLLLGFNG